MILAFHPAKRVFSFMDWMKRVVLRIQPAAVIGI